MKFKHSLFILLSLIVLAMISCNLFTSKEAKRKDRKFVENPIQLDTLSISSSQPLVNNDIKADCRVSLNLIYPHQYQNETVKSNLQEQLNESILQIQSSDLLLTNDAREVSKLFIDNYFKEYQAVVSELAKISNNATNNDSLYTTRYNITSSLLYNEANFISLEVVKQLYRGKPEALANLEKQLIVLDLTDGKKLQEQNLFVDNYQPLLAQLLKDALNNHLGISEEEDLEYLAYWGAADIGPNNNFAVLEDGIQYTFNPGEYADPKIGVIDIFLSYDELSDIIKPDSPLKIFIDKE